MPARAFRAPMSSWSTTAPATTPTPPPRAAGARVIASLGSGKGAALWTGVRETHGEIVLFLDGDVTNPRPETAAALVHALTADSSLMMVRAAYERPYGSRPGEGGRVTELTARPALDIAVPHARSPPSTARRRGGDAPPSDRVGAASSTATASTSGCCSTSPHATAPKRSARSASPAVRTATGRCTNSSRWRSKCCA